MLSMVQNVVTEMGSKKQFGVLMGVVLFVVLTLTVVDAKAQIRQFANDTKASSEYSPSDRSASPGNAWSALEMTGAPNVYPKCGDIRGAWAASTPDKDKETVELSFATPVYATQLNVYETNVPGSIVRVEFINADGTNVVGRDFSVSTPSCPNIFTVNASTPFLTNRVRLTLNTSRSGYEEIDAVELVGTASSNGGGNNGGGNNGGGGPGSGNGGQVNRAPLAPTLISPSHGSANHNPAAINFQFSNNGDPDGDTVTFYLNIAQYDPCAEQWKIVYEGHVTSTTFQLTRFQEGAVYAWRVFSMDEQKRSNPWYTASNWAVFSTGTSADITILICTSEGIKTARSMNAPSAQVSLKGLPDGKNANATVKQLQPKQGSVNAGNVQITIKIYTVAGKLVRTIDSETENALALAGLANGTYLVVVEQKNEDGRIHRTIKPVVVLH